jgi:hypothetical protein
MILAAAGISHLVHLTYLCSTKVILYEKHSMLRRRNGHERRVLGMGPHSPAARVSSALS